MKLTNLKALPVLMGAIALFATPLMRSTQAESSNCPDEFEGISLSTQQEADLEVLEAEFDSTLDSILPISPETETRIEQLEDNFDSQVDALFSSQQQQQLEQLDQWAETEALAIAPELAEAFEDEAFEDENFEDEDFEDEDFEDEDFEDEDFEDEDFEDELNLTPEQESALESLEEDYETRLQSILTLGQMQQIETLEKQLEEDIDAILPEPNEAQLAQIEAAEAEIEQRALQILTAQQRQQFESNLACEAS